MLWLPGLCPIHLLPCWHKDECSFASEIEGWPTPFALHAFLPPLTYGDHTFELPGAPSGPLSPVRFLLQDTTAHKFCRSEEAILSTAEEIRNAGQEQCHVVMEDPFLR